MVKNTELRIGNWVHSLETNTHVKITAIDNEGWIAINDMTFDGTDESMIDPIELTEEILLKCGFVKEKLSVKDLYLIEYGDFYLVLDGNNKYYHVKISNNGFNYEKQVGLGILKHLHQLQNIYFALTNKELEYNP